jgi:hypothetical protein
VYPTIIDKVNSKEIPSSDRFRNIEFIMLLNIPSLLLSVVFANTLYE